jgi:zinc/manganese transport system ATP-binding protein
VRDAGPAIDLRNAALRVGDRSLWQGLDLAVSQAEFLAVLGPNGVGKTSLLRVLLGLTPLSEGDVKVLGRPPAKGSPLVGYVPQQRSFDPTLPLRGLEFVELGVDGHRWGIRRMADRRSRARGAIRAVSADRYSHAPIGLLSGGEQQRLRLAQALVSDPALLLCDEPLLSLDLASQRMVVDLLDARRRERGTAVVFVTHEINPVLQFVDRVLYLAPGSWAVGTPDQVLTTQTLSRLYGTNVDVLRVRGRVVVVGVPDEPDTALGQTGHVHVHADGVHVEDGAG